MRTRSQNPGRRYLDVLGTGVCGTISLKRMAAELGLAPEIVETEVEPWLIEQGEVVVTHQGRRPRWLRLLEEGVRGEGKKEGTSGGR